MKITLSKILFWTPRLLSILFLLFISLFALDVFGQGYTFWQTLQALAMHLIPTAILLAVLLLAWRWEWLGAILFASFGITYLVVEWGRFDWTPFALITGPLVLVGLLFFADWRYRKFERSQI